MLNADESVNQLQLAVDRRKRLNRRPTTDNEIAISELHICLAAAGLARDLIPNTRRDRSQGISARVSRATALLAEALQVVVRPWYINQLLNDVAHFQRIGSSELRTK